jgi:predicted esterase
MNVYLHGFGTSAAAFRSEWEKACSVPADGIFPDGYERDPLTGLRCWFPLTGREEQLAKALAPSADRLEQDLAHLLTTARHETVSIFGHSQGGMLALELARRRRLPVANVESYAAYLPLPGCGPTGALRGLRAVIHSSTADRYIARERVEHSADLLRAAGAEVEERVLTHVDHAFSAAWVESSQLGVRRDA